MNTRQVLERAQKRDRLNNFPELDVSGAKHRKWMERHEAEVLRNELQTGLVRDRIPV